jgi:uncharacterized protein
MKIGVIADTHGVLYPEVAQIFQGVDRIIHAGDIGGDNVLFHLHQLGPVVAVRGNYDQDRDLQLLPDPSMIELDGLPTLLTHRLVSFEWSQGKALFARMLEKFPLKPRIVIFGHTHFPVAESVEGVYFFNPGYCGPDPLEGEPSVGILTIEGGEITGRIVKLERK